MYLELKMSRQSFDIVDKDPDPPLPCVSETCVLYWAWPRNTPCSKRNSAPFCSDLDSHNAL